MNNDWRRQLVRSVVGILGTAVAISLVLGGLALAGADALGLTSDGPDDPAGSAPQPTTAAATHSPPTDRGRSPTRQPSRQHTRQRTSEGNQTPSTKKPDKANQDEPNQDKADQSKHRGNNQRKHHGKDHGKDHRKDHRKYHRKHHRAGGQAHRMKRPTLAASPRSVRKFGRVQLVGRYRGHDGARLRVQRHGHRWHDFPVTVTVRHGRFHTWVMSGYRGPNAFRVLDKRHGRSSAPVTVRVH